MYSHIAHVASNRANAAPGTIAKTSPGFAGPTFAVPRISQITSAGAHTALDIAKVPACFTSLPLELLNGICANSGQHDLTRLARTCSSASAPAERRLWKHLNLVRNEIDLGATWRRTGPESRFYKGMSQRAFRQLIKRLTDRPDLANSVQKLTVCAGLNFSNKLSDVINLVGPTLREIEFRATSDSRATIDNPTYHPWMINLDYVFDAIKPLHRVNKMTLNVTRQWADTWKYALATTPNLVEFRFDSIQKWGGGWEYDDGTDLIVRPSIYDAYESDGPIPRLPYLKHLSIGQMAKELEPAIMEVIKTSAAPTIKLWLEDPAGSYNERSKEFQKFLTQWQEDGRLLVEIGLPDYTGDELDFFAEEDDKPEEDECTLDDDSVTSEEEQTDVEEEEEDAGKVDFSTFATWGLEFASWARPDDVQLFDVKGEICQLCSVADLIRWFLLFALGICLSFI